MTPATIITDDDPALRKMLGCAARRAGYDPILCANGAELIETLKARSEPATVFLDIHMAEMDGIEAIEGLKSVDTRFRLRFMTGGPDAMALAATMIAQGQDLDVGETLFKPFSLKQFGEVLRQDTAHLEGAQAG